MSSLIFGPGNDFRERLANASVGRVAHLYRPERLNFSPRVGLAYDPFGDGKTNVRAGFSLAFQPHHGQSITGARALPPDAVQIVSQPSVGIGTRILYDITLPFNPEFARGLNQQGGVNPLPGKRARSLFDIPHRFARLDAEPFWGRTGWIMDLLNGWQPAAIITAQSGRPFSVWNGSRQGDYNLDGGGGAVGGGFYDRPNALLPKTIKTKFN